MRKRPKMKRITLQIAPDALAFATAKAEQERCQDAQAYLSALLGSMLFAMMWDEGFPFELPEPGPTLPDHSEIPF